MLKKLVLPLSLVTTLLIAADIPFIQFTENDYNVYGTSQDWTPAQMISLSVKKGSTVYLSNYTRSWYENLPNLGDVDYAAGYDMTANHYGYVYAEVDADGNAVPVGPVHYADGTTKEVTVKNPNGPQTQTLTGYKLGTFDKDAEIFLVMTPNGYETEVNSFSPVNAVGYESILVSRQINTYDLSGQTRVNFGTADGVGHEFIIGYEAEAPSGQPLPGVLVTTFIGLCGVGVFAKHKKHLKK